MPNNVQSWSWSCRRLIWKAGIWASVCESVLCCWATSNSVTVPASNLAWTIFRMSRCSFVFCRASSTTSSCTWKGQARYYTLVVDGQENPDAAWYYPDPKPAARSVKHHVAFWRGVEVEK